MHNKIMTTDTHRKKLGSAARKHSPSPQFLARHLLFLKSWPIFMMTMKGGPSMSTKTYNRFMTAASVLMFGGSGFVIAVGLWRLVA